MKTRICTLALLLGGLWAGQAFGQAQAAASKPAPPGGHEPPPQAYADCKGKQAGTKVQHTTREGVVAAICEDSPKGLVARPSRPKAGASGPVAR